MKTASSSGRINAVSAVKILVVPTNAGGDSPPLSLLQADVALLRAEKDSKPILLGKAELKSTWPPNVLKLATELHNAIEDHLLQVYFSDERKEDGNRRDYPIDIPEGLGGSGLVSPEDEPQQL